MLSDILPTGFECGVLNGQLKPGDTVAIVGAGPLESRSSSECRVQFPLGDLGSKDKPFHSQGEALFLVGTGHKPGSMLHV